MKTTTPDWQAPNVEASNSSGFSGLPGGYMGYIDFEGEWKFAQKGYNSLYCIGTLDSTKIYHYYQVYYALSTENAQIIQGPFGSVSGKWGTYVRCVKDKEQF